MHHNVARDAPLELQWVMALLGTSICDITMGNDVAMDIHM